MSPRIALLSATVCLALCVAARAQDKPTTQPLIGEMRVGTYPGYTYLYASQETTLAKVKETIGRMMPALMKAAEAGKFQIAGSPVMVYKGTKDPTQPFTMEVGVPVRQDTAGFDEFTVRKTEEFRAATLLYTGPASTIGKAIEKAFSDVFKNQLTPTDEIREVYLYWEGEESPNNIVLIQVGVK